MYSERLIQMYLDSNTNVVDWSRKIQYMSNNYNASEIGQRITARRHSLGMSQEALAARAGVSQGTIGHIESGRNRNTTKLAEIAKALGWTVDELLGTAPINDKAQVKPIKSTWPFRVTLDEVLTLSASDIDLVDGYITGLVHKTGRKKRTRESG